MKHHGRAPELLHHPAVVETPGMEPKKGVWVQQNETSGGGQPGG